VTGELAEVAFERLRFDSFVLGACGIDERNGVTTHLPADARVKRAAVASCGRTIAAADASKLSAVAFGHVCPLEALDRLVTDAPAPLTAALEAAGLIVDRV
jgi:DeoR/GlpR family transcriptional regulator of sugar metabolism